MVELAVFITEVRTPLLRLWSTLAYFHIVKVRQLPTRSITACRVRRHSRQSQEHSLHHTGVVCCCANSLPNRHHHHQVACVLPAGRVDTTAAGGAHWHLAQCIRTSNSIYTRTLHCYPAFHLQIKTKIGRNTTSIVIRAVNSSAVKRKRLFFKVAIVRD